MGKSTPKAPQPPDPFEVAAADAQYNRINQFTPLGNLVFTNPGAEPAQTTQTGLITGGLNPNARQLLPQQSPISTTPQAPSKGSGQTPFRPTTSQPLLANGPDGATDQFTNTVPGAGNQNPFAPQGTTGGLGRGSNASASATIQLNPALQFTENLRLTSDVNLLADALNRQGNLNSDPIDLSQFGDIQSDIDTSNINFTSPNFSGLPGLQQAPLGSFNPNTPNVQTGIGQTPSLQNVLPNVDVQGQINTGGVNQLPTNIDQFRGDVEQSVFDRGRRLLDPIFSDQERSINQRLATQGLPISGEAADRDLTRFEDARNRAFVELADQSVITGGSQASRALADQLATQGQQFGQAAAQGQFANQAAGQQFGQGLAGGQFTNSAAQQAFDQAFARGNFANQSQNQLFGQQLQGIGFNNQTALQNAAQNQDIRSQLFNEGIAGASAQNAAAAQNLALQQQLLQNQNAARSQGLNEQSVVRQNQFNELASLLGLQQVQAPTFQNFIQPGQVDTLGAFSLNQQAQQQAFQAENSRNNAALGGLFGLGSSALLGPLAGIFGG